MFLILPLEAAQSSLISVAAKSGEGYLRRLAHSWDGSLRGLIKKRNQPLRGISICFILIPKVLGEHFLLHLDSKKEDRDHG